MIETLSLRNFKLLRHVDLRLQPLTVIVGPNASGKSSILQALEWLTSYFSREGGQRGKLAQPAEVRSQESDSSEAVVFSLTGRFDDQHYNQGVIGESGWDHIRTTKDKYYSWFPGATVSLSLDVKRLTAPSYPRNVSLQLPSSGEGLSSILASLSLEQPEKFQQIIDRLRQVVPTVQKIRFRRTDLGNGEIGFQMLFDMQGARGVPAYSVSEGTLLTLGLLTALAAPQPPELVLIDDLERGLHPKALGDLVGQLRRLQEQNPELQIVATSHSPYLLDFLKAEEILLTSLDEDGYAVVKPLTDHPEYERWKDLMAPGEFWSTVGEKWITEKSPAPAE